MKNDFEISSFFENADLVLATQQQIAKDFAKFNVNVEAQFLESSCSYDEIIIVVQNLLLQIMDAGEQNLLQFFYTIDLSEKEFLSCLNQNNTLLLLSEKVVKREAMKVYFRKYY